MAVERSLILFKPDAVQRKLCGELLSRIERKGLKVVGLKRLYAKTWSETTLSAAAARLGVV